ncbi:hypothetical protein PVAP13_5NG091224 [Panicum virgatum]|uniref:Uncharacterized protein n=1 Tax=Panicum virgatum TaxID=38727 RepID=A0A8T0RQQ8_PANVG|nr:hypothetical protein PVAP13_5NG091224 [Panicum virgatum]
MSFCPAVTDIGPQEAGDLSDSACSLLASALPHLESPSAWCTSDAKHGGVRLITLAEGKLEDASSELARCASSMEAAELLDRRRGPATRHPPASEAALSASMNEVPGARARVEEALRAIDRCRGHLGAAKLLLGHPDGPGADGCIEAERVAVVRAVEAALGALGLGGEGG